MKKLLLSILVLAANGCAEHDLGALSTYTPLPEPNMFQWRTIADTVYPVNSERAEQQRLEQLDKIARMNPPCDQGYRITNRAATKKVDSLLGKGIYDVFYTIDCNG
ncbi:hypothetical protein [Aliiruegeria lutimaris]|uniref:Uncharacterized protein n=1 Tax=Aliiruegeria lutimaris TaxID=571298 RepID=A0A1G9GB71_9RHOB|nr:hypothetical protein [Aliiruegeria lutimaris]SDK97948.1 hypothetical protein SAMN04488026_106219 [Aliiruegeria lutimaris]